MFINSMTLTQSGYSMSKLMEKILLIGSDSPFPSLPMEIRSPSALLIVVTVAVM